MVIFIKLQIGFILENLHKDGSTFDIRRGIHNKGKIIKTKTKPTHRYIYINDGVYWDLKKDVEQ
jgi:hypothetical protein